MEKRVSGSSLGKKNQFTFSHRNNKMRKRVPHRIQVSSSHEPSDAVHTVRCLRKNPRTEHRSDSILLINLGSQASRPLNPVPSNFECKLCIATTYLELASQPTKLLTTSTPAFPNSSRSTARVSFTSRSHTLH